MIRGYRPSRRLALQGIGSSLMVSVTDLPLPAHAVDPDGSPFVDMFPKPMPALNFVDGEGKRLSLDSFRGKYILLNIWATWCGPCRIEMPTLDGLQKDLGGPEFLVVPLSIDAGGIPVIRSFYHQIKIKSLGIYLDETQSVLQTLNIDGIPQTFLIDRNGKLIGQRTGPAIWNSPSIKNYLSLTIVKPQSKLETMP